MALYSRRTSTEVRDLSDWPVVLPIGSIEQHGPHLPVDTDSLIVTELAEELARLREVLVLPTLVYSVSEEHMDFCGTITLKPATFKAALKDIASSLRAHGFSRFCILNYHGGNKRYILELLPELESLGLEVSYHRVLGRIGRFDHAGEVETSLMLYLCPDRVRLDRIKAFKYSIPGKEPWKTIDYAEEGVIGEAHAASEEKGAEYFKKIISELLEEICDGEGKKSD